MSNSHDKIAVRLSQILIKLNDGEKLNEIELANEFGVSLRTIQRDFAQRLNYLPLKKEFGLYSLESYALGKLSFKDIKDFALISGVKSLFPSLSKEFITDLLNTKINPIYQVNHLGFEKLNDKMKDFEELSASIVKYNIVSFKYNNKERNINPYKLLNNNGIWYLLADENNTLKTYTFNKIEDLEIKDVTFKPNEEFIREISKNNHHWYSDDVIEVELEIKPPLMEYFLRREILRNQTILEQSDDKLILSTKVSYEEEILGVVKHGIPHIKILSPKSLQNKLQNILIDYIK